MTSREIIEKGMSKFAEDPSLLTKKNIFNLRIATRLVWEQEEMGGLGHVQFAYRNDTPIVPLGHECHPLELIKRGYIDGKGWPKDNRPKIKIFKWPDGNHYYAYVDGKEVIHNGSQKWNTPKEATDAAEAFLKNYK